MSGKDLDNLLAELDQIEDPKRASRAIPPPPPAAAPEEELSSSPPPPPPRAPTPPRAPSPPPAPQQESEPAWESGGNSNKRASASVQKLGKPWEDELDALVAKFDTLDNAPKGGAPPPPARDPPPRSAPSHSEDIRSNKRVSVYNPKPSSASDKCGGCGQLVTGEHLVALGKIWHPNHFTCSNCGNGIRGDFYETDSKRTCKNCSEALFRCTKCGQPITGEYFVGSGKMLHSHCLDRQSCAKCGGAISSSSMIALDRHYHTECFTCANCNTRLGTSFFQKDGRPHCSNCVGQGGRGGGGGGGNINCYKCSNSITGTYVSYEGRSYHNGCFNCNLCGTPLSHEAFFVVSGQPACQHCANSK